MVDISPQPVTSPSLTEGIQAIEATGTNLDLTAGAEGMATFPTNDYQVLSGENGKKKAAQTTY